MTSDESKIRQALGKAGLYRVIFWILLDDVVARPIGRATGLHWLSDAIFIAGLAALIKGYTGIGTRQIGEALRRSEVSATPEYAEVLIKCMGYNSIRPSVWDKLCEGIEAMDAATARKIDSGFRKRLYKYACGGPWFAASVVFEKAADIGDKDALRFIDRAIRRRDLPVEAREHLQRLADQLTA